ncbi:transposase family protein [Helicobacter sp. UBA3407]|uniref:integrase catalytic domain-containing protein n=1 Tax=Helicobacter sp. UBA3407 TaxID=1946588 RepID=UPI0026229565|nr:transposase family protein [Helicobacter sp. UBA3407]
MGQWISSKEFAKSLGITDRAVRKQAQTKKILKFNTKYFSYTYIKGVGGYAGKILQIWNTPLSQEQVEAIEKGYPIKYVLEEMGEVAQPNVMESKDSKTLVCKENKMEEKGANNEKTSQNIQGETLHTRGIDCVSKHYCRTASSSNSSLYRNDLSACAIKDEVITSCNKEEIQSSKDNLTAWHNLTSSQKAQAKQRERILQDYESAKASGIRVADFLILKNSEDSTLKLTQGKLFDWQRKYKAQGLSALSDKRGVAKLGTTSLPKWAQEEVIKMWRVMGSGYLNRMQLWRELHIVAHLYVKDYSYKKFLQCEIPPLFSLNTLNRFLDSYFKANSLEYTLITYGTDKTDSYKEPAYGMQRDLYTLPNQLWQIDSSPLDAIVLDKDGKQIRPSILSVIDVYSGRSVAYLSETSDSNAVVRLMWKAFQSMGKPQAIQFDNGKDYLSKQVQGLVDGLGIKFVRSTAYKGKAKAVVERRFRTIQGSYITALSSYIGRNVSERSAREQQIPKRERKSKDTLGNPIKTQQKHIIDFEISKALLDEAVEFWNIDRVSRKWGKAQGKSPMDLWSEANFQRINVDYTRFLLYAEGYR